MAFWVYILRCRDGRDYTGHTDNLERRVGEHRSGGDFTSRRRPVKLIWSQDFVTRIEALEAEHRIKPGSRAKKEALARGDWKALSFFSRPPRERPSTSLGTNGRGEPAAHPPLGRNGPSESATPPPFVPSEAEGPSPTPSSHPTL